MCTWIGPTLGQATLTQNNFYFLFSFLAPFSWRGRQLVLLIQNYISFMTTQTVLKFKTIACFSGQQWLWALGHSLFLLAFHKILFPASLSATFSFPGIFFFFCNTISYLLDCQVLGSFCFVMNSALIQGQGVWAVPQFMTGYWKLFGSQRFEFIFLQLNEWCSRKANFAVRSSGDLHYTKKIR